MQETEYVSQYFTLGDLLVTNQGLNEPNYPNDSSHIGNIKKLAAVLDELLITLGPFQILSGYRTKELQTKLGEGGNPTSTKLSFHEIGRAVDIYPTEMTLDEYFGLILANEDLKNKFAEISIKNSQNSLHLSVNVPGDWRTPKIMGLTADRTYASLSSEEIQGYIDSVTKFVGDSLETASKSKLPILVAGILAVGGFFILTSAGRKTA